jgi:hypothetical protein
MRAVRTAIGVAGICVSAACGLPTLAALDYSSIGAAYHQNFNSLASAGTGITWTNDYTDPSSATLPGWNLFRVTAPNNFGAVAFTLYDTNAGNGDAGRFYSFGDALDGDRALGGVGHNNFGHPFNFASVPNNSLNGWIAVSFVNDAPLALTQFTVGYAGEQWRDGGNFGPPEFPAPQTTVFEYGFGSDFDAVTWTTPGGNFDFTSPIYDTPDAPVDGNADGRVNDLGGTISDVNWTPGETLWLRWVEWNDAAVDHGLAIDDFSFSATAAIPEPSAAVFVSAVAIAVALGMAARWLWGVLVRSTV